MYRVKEVNADMVFPVLYREMNRMEKEGINFPVAESYGMLRECENVYMLLNYPTYKINYGSDNDEILINGIKKYLSNYGLEWIMNPFDLNKYIIEFLSDLVESIGGGHYITNHDGNFLLLNNPEAILKDPCDIMLIKRILENL